jgi:lipoprotein-releasing system ATP-binding protein
MTLIEARNIKRSYTDTAETVHVLNGIDFSLEKGDLVGIFGASGAGKSTFLHILGGLDSATEGEVLFNGKRLNGMNERDISNFRNKMVGFVFQFYHLMPEFTARENVMMPALISGTSKKDAAKKADEALDAVGLTHRAEHMPSMLSGGEQQRVAMARAAVQAPPMILADEPTGNLDRETGTKVWEYLLSLNKKKGMALVVVTHNRDLVRDLKKTYEIKDGRLGEFGKV